jgi:integrase
LQRWHKIGRAGVFTPALARTEAIKVLRSVALGEDPSAERVAIRNSMDVSALCDLYSTSFNSINKKSSTIKSDNSWIKGHIKPKIGKHKVVLINRDMIEQFMHDTSVTLSPSSARRMMGLLSAIFTFSVDRKLRPDNPCIGIKKPKENKKTRRLSNAEYHQLGLAIRSGGTNSDLFMLLALTGMRSSEARLLKWSELNMERGTVLLTDTKTGRSIRPLAKAAIDIIKAHNPGVAPFIFENCGKPLGNLARYWKLLGMASDVTPHTLRHSFASLAADLGLADSTIAGLLGHARQSITSRYMHLADKALIEAADLVAGETMRLMRGS